MKAIQPVHLHNTGPKVSNLHKGLLFLLFHQPGISNKDRETLQKRLAPELEPESGADVRRKRAQAATLKEMLDNASE